MNIQLEKIAKSYAQKTWAIKDIDLTLHSGTVYCLLGKNGAGKSTMLNIISGLVAPTSGKLLIDGTPYKELPRDFKKRLGLQSQFNQLIGELNGYDFLFWIGLLYDMPKDLLTAQIEKLLAYFFDEGEDIYKPCITFSTGMQRKITICSAILHKPDILILDEPFANLDPIASQKLCDFINAYRSDNRMILVSSHDILYVNKIATHIGILAHANLVFNDTLEKLTDAGASSVDTALLKYLEPTNTGDGDNISLIDSIV